MNPKKPLVYVLGLAVCCIWGLILYRVFAGQGNDGDEGRIMPVAQGNAKRPLPRQFPDTASLLLNYPDPFTGEVPVVRDTLKIKAGGRIIPAPPPEAPPPDPMEQVKYLGFVADGKGSRRLAIVSYQGQEKMLKEGDTIGAVRIMTIKKDAILLRHGQKMKLIKTE